MIILSIRTDKPEAEIGLYQNAEQLGYLTWQAHKQLAETIHIKIKDLLGQNHLDLTDVKATMVYSGPGSFTGLRIGLSVANALAYSLKIPIVATKGSTWQAKAIEKLQKGQNDQIALPHYGRPPHITKQKR